jgi:hypothetical protein
MHIQEISELYGIKLIKCYSDLDIISSYDYYLIMGAGIISDKALKGKRIISCQPGVIQLVRGKDAFKWAIHDKMPLGNILHHIDVNID